MVCVCPTLVPCDLAVPQEFPTFKVCVLPMYPKVPLFLLPTIESYPCTQGSLRSSLLSFIHSVRPTHVPKDHLFLNTPPFMVCPILVATGPSVLNTSFHSYVYPVLPLLFGTPTLVGIFTHGDQVDTGLR